MHGREHGRDPSRATISESAALWVLAAFSVAAVVGFATFGLHPQLLARYPWTLPFFGVAFPLFSVGQILLAASALLLVLARRAPLRWMLALAAVYLISLASELSGVAFGFPFGPYHYTHLLGPRWFDLVPVVIPLSWFLMAVPSYYIARWAMPDGGFPSRVVMGALVLTAWDLALDPAMSHATILWRWEVEGAYYGMPWVNLTGWLFTSVLLMGVLSLLGGEEWIGRLPHRWTLLFYAVNVLLPLGMALAAGLVWVGVVTLATYLVLGAVVPIWNRVVVAEPAEA